MILMSSDSRIVPLRDNVNYRKQRRKKQAKSKFKQIHTSAGDFETIDGNAWLFTIAWYESQVNAKGNALHRKPKILKSALEEYKDEVKGGQFHCARREIRERQVVCLPCMN